MSLSKEDKKNISKIKKLFRSRDFTNIEIGIELVKSLNNPNIFDQLLGDVKYKSDQWSGTFTHDWKGAGPDQHYFLTSILGLLNFAPKGSKGYSIRESVTILKLKGEVSSGYSHESSLLYLGYLSNFFNLKYLIFESYKEVLGFEKIYSLPIEALEIKNGDTLPNQKEKWSFKKLKTLHLELPEKENITHLDFLSEATNIENLKIYGGSGNKEGTCIKGLNSLLNLKFLSTSRLGFSKLDGISKLKNLIYVKLTELYLEDISGLVNSKNLEFIDLSYSKILSDITPIKKLKNIKLADFSATSLKSLSGLENSIDLIALKIARTPIENLDVLLKHKNIRAVDARQCYQLNSIKGLKNALNLNEILLHESNQYSYNFESGKQELSKEGSLKNLEGIENCLELRTITLSKTALTNLDPLIKCKKIFRNNYTKWDEETPEWDGNTGSQDNPFWNVTEEVKKVGYGNLYQAHYIGDICRDYYKEREYSEPKLNEFFISDCHKLESVKGLKNSGIQLLKITNCPSIKNIDYLVDWPLLQCCDFSDCNNLESVEVLASLNLIDRLILKKCYKVRPKPRFLLMNSFEKVNEYLSKFKKEKTVKLDSTKDSISDKLESLLLSNDYKNIDLGLELANTIGDTDIFNFLIQGVQYLRKKIIPNSKFLGNTKTKEYRDYAIQGLISIAPDSCVIATEIKKNFKKITLNGTQITSLLSVSGFTNLEELIIKNTSISTISDLSRLVNLKRILFMDNPELNNLSGIKGLINISEIAIRNSKKIIDLNFISDLNNLSALQINNCGLITTDGIFNVSKLKNINFNDNLSLEQIDALGKINSLNTITISGCPSIKNIKALSLLQNLSFLKLDNHNLENTDDLSSLIEPILEGLRK